MLLVLWGAKWYFMHQASKEAAQYGREQLAALQMEAADRSKVDDYFEAAHEQSLPLAYKTAGRRYRVKSELDLDSYHDYLFYYLSQEAKNDGKLDLATYLQQQR